MGGKQSSNVATSDTSPTSGPVAAISSRPLAAEGPSTTTHTLDDTTRDSYRTRPLPSLPEPRPHFDTRPIFDSRPLPPIPPRTGSRNEPINIDANHFLAHLANNDRLHSSATRHRSHTHSSRDRLQRREERPSSYHDDHRRRERQFTLGMLLRDLTLSEPPPTPPPERKCPHCSTNVPETEYDSHLRSCTLRPRIHYNESVLSQNVGECTICLDDMTAGETIARLPCLCVYHLNCVEEWFRVKECCPEHPDLTY